MTLDGKSILITGALGFLGQHLVKALEGTAGKIIMLDNRFALAQLVPLVAPLCPCQADIGDKNEPLFIPMRDIDVVFHLAAIRAPLCDENPRLCVESMIDGTMNVIEAAKQAGVKRFVFASSRMVYDANPGMYGLAKKMGEQMLMRSGLSWCALRYFNLYGPGMNYGTLHDEVLVKWMGDIETGAKPIINEDMRRDFVYVDDAVAATLCAAKMVPDLPLDIASGQLVKLPIVHRKLSWIAGKTPYSPDEWMTHPNGLTRPLGWEARITLDDGLKRTWEWWQNRERPLR